MPRFIVTDSFPLRPADIPYGFELVAPCPEAGRGLRTDVRSLYQIAKDALKTQGFGVATSITAAGTLREAAHSVLPDEDPSSLARHYGETVAAILRSGIDTDKLAEFGSERAQAVANITNAYRSMLARNRLVDRDAVLTEAVRRNAVTPRQVILYGYFRARQLPARCEEIELIDRLAADGSIFYLPDSDGPLFSSNRAWIGFLKEKGWQVRKSDVSTEADTNWTALLARRFADEKPGTSVPPEQVAAIEFPNLELEVRGVLARAKAAALDGVPLEEIAVVCRDLKAYARPIVEVAREYGLPVQLDHDVPLAESDLGQFVGLIFEVVDRRSAIERVSGTGNTRRGFLYEPTLRLLLHRFGPGLNDADRMAAYSSLPSDYDAWRSITNEVEPLYFAGDRRPLEWVHWLKSLLGRWTVRAKAKIGSSAEEVRAYERFFDSIAQLERDRGPDEIHISEFAVDVSDVLINVATPLHLSRGGVRIREPNDLPGSSCEMIFVIGMAEGVFPAVTSDSSVIDFFECNKLRKHGIHFQDALEVPRWEALTFYFSLLACRRHLVLSYPKFVADREQIESSYFGRLGLAPGRSEDRFVSGGAEYRRAFLNDPSPRNGDHVFAAAAHQFQVERRRESAGPPDEYDGVIGVSVPRRSWSASSLARFGSCRFKWFAFDVLRLRSPKEAETELAAVTRGTLLHKTLEIAVGRSRTGSDLRRAVLAALEDAFREAESLAGPLTLVSNWQLRRHEQIEKLRMAVSAKEFVADGASVIEVEKEFEAELCGLTIKGKIDRIDRLSDESILAIDYKHSMYVGKVKDDSGYLKVEIQLPLYCAAALPKLYPDHVHAGGQFFHIAEQKVTAAREADLVGFLEKVKIALENGNFAVDPDVDRDACEYCEFDVVCRVGPRLARKRA